MNKEDFLKDLRGCLSILEDQEQEDILEEYAQHIDMKLQKGLSEEEAIRDFGPMEELAAEILEAYHVKPEFRQKNALPELPKRRMGKAGDVGKPLMQLWQWMKGNGKAAAHAIGKSFRWLGEKGRGVADRVFGIFQRKPSDAAPAEAESGVTVPAVCGNAKTAGTEQGSEQRRRREGQMTNGFGNCFRAGGRGIVFMWKWFLGVCAWCLRLAWNVGWLMVSLLCAGMAMIALAGAGALFVLLFQGYPLVGFALISVGAMLCFGTLSCGAFSLMVRKGRRGNGTGMQGKEPGQPGGEVQYE